MTRKLTLKSFKRRSMVLALSMAAAMSPWLMGDAAAQNLFAPAILVDDEVITRFEVEQRARFLALLRVPGDPARQSRKELVDDRLKLSAARSNGIAVSEEAIVEGMTELAERANLTLEQFVQALEENGVSQQTLRDYAKAGISWREFTGARFLSQARPSEKEIDRAMGQAGAGSVQVLISEVIMPINQANAPQIETIAVQISQMKDYASFSSAATQYSAADTRFDGGRLPWMPLGKLPPALQEVVLNLAPAEVTEPLPLQGAVALFQMRGIREVAGSAARYAAIEYASYYIPGGRSPEALEQAQSLAGTADTCDDLYGIAKGQDPSVLERQSLPPSQVPVDIALELSKLDPGENSYALTRNNGETLVFLMLCGRTAELGEGDSRETVARALTLQRLTALSDSYLEQLRAEAKIVEK